MEIREIKSSLNILTVLNHYNLKPNKNGMLKCPFHEDKDPSLKVYTNTNTFNCFGCGKAGDQIEFIQLKENCSKHEAITKAKSLVNPLHTINPMPMEQKEDKNLLPRLAVLGKVAQDSKASYKRTAKARDYIRTRKLNPDILEVGYIGSEFGKKWNEQLKKSALNLGIFKEYRKT
jgi:DNA primase